MEAGHIAHIHAEEGGVEVLDLGHDAGGDDGRVDGRAVVDGLDQRGLHRGGVGRGQADGLARGLDGLIADAEDVVYGVVHNAQEAEQDQHRQQHGHAAAHGVVAVLLLELHQLLLLLLGVVLVLLLNLGDQRLEHGHLGRGLLLMDAQGEQQQLEDEGGNDHGCRVVADEAVQDLHQRADQYGQEIHKRHSLSFCPVCARDLYFYVGLCCAVQRHERRCCGDNR